MLLTACKPATALPLAATATLMPTDMPTPTVLSQVSPSPLPPQPSLTPTEQPRPTATQPAEIPAAPQEVTFYAVDGQELHGLYYRAAVEPAPTVVLMHWVNGNQSDWYEIAVWLQNRGQANPFPLPGDSPWWNPTWFPALPAERSYAVFIFNFRTCEQANERCSLPFDQWGKFFLDAQAAMIKVRKLPGVDVNNIVAIGSSIGADGAANACFWLNAQYPDSCRGALSLSPGGYLGIGYLEAVRKMSDPPLPVWCLADENENFVCDSAKQAKNPNYQAITIPSGGHGNFLLRPNLQPLPMQLMIDFLYQATGR
ncbi:MAG: hypothetical protein KA988_00780 [Longilinea sp.]|nr:hypothetical protein [Longilinea sp.]